MPSGCPGDIPRTLFTKKLRILQFLPQQLERNSVHRVWIFLPGCIFFILTKARKRQEDANRKNEPNRKKTCTPMQLHGNCRGEALCLDHNTKGHHKERLAPFIKSTFLLRTKWRTKKLNCNSATQLLHQSRTTPVKKRNKSLKRPQNFSFGVKYGAHQKSEKSAQNFL